MVKGALRLSERHNHNRKHHMQTPYHIYYLGVKERQVLLMSSTLATESAYVSYDYDARVDQPLDFELITALVKICQRAQTSELIRALELRIILG